MSRALSRTMSRTLTFALGLAACGGTTPATPDAGPVDWPLMEVAASATPEAGVRRELFTVPGATPPANPTTSVATPVEYNATQVARYRQDVTPPAPARAILVAYPGFLGGAGSWDQLARQLVKGAAARGQVIEVWAIDRRANLLEDLRGADTAEAAGNPEIANGWYFGTDTIAGQPFPGFRAQEDLSYMSEWGLATHVEDLHAVIARIAAADRKARVVLLGHSLGGFFAEAYAAWRFADGSRGADELAGLVLIDGVLSAAPITETEYHQGVANGLFSQTGVDTIRSDGPRFFEIPLFGIGIFARVEVLSLRALTAPDAVVADPGRDGALRIQLSLGSAKVPPLTNAAALGWGLDNNSNALTITAPSLGEPTGGPVATYSNSIAGKDLTHPASETATYAWLDATPTDPDDRTHIADLAHAFTDGRTNFAEWYFPTRLTLDLAAVGGAAVPADGWQATAGLRAFDGALDDAPILCIPAQLQTAADCALVQARVAPTIGPGRPGAAATRAMPAGFATFPATGYTHLDPLTAMARPDNLVPATILDFALASTPAGTTAVPPAL
jgi:pimeloyl-ACP methyl ester carboxylesterase